MDEDFKKSPLAPLFQRGVTPENSSFHMAELIRFILLLI
jgi:hypothetical protein